MPCLDQGSRNQAKGNLVERKEWSGLDAVVLHMLVPYSMAWHGADTAITPPPFIPAAMCVPERIVGSGHIMSVCILYDDALYRRSRISLERKQRAVLSTTVRKCLTRPRRALSAQTTFPSLLLEAPWVSEAAGDEAFPIITREGMHASS